MESPRHNSKEANNEYANRMFCKLHHQSIRVKIKTFPILDAASPSKIPTEVAS